MFDAPKIPFSAAASRENILLPDAIFLAVLCANFMSARLDRTDGAGAFARSQSGKRKLARCVASIYVFYRVACYSLKAHKPLVDFGMHTELY